MQNAAAECTSHDCTSSISDKERHDYDIQAESVYNQCCPQYVRRACKEADKIYEVQ